NQPGCILTSVLKNTEVPVYAIAKSYKDGKMADVTGKVISYDLGSKATGITDLATIEAAVKDSGKTKWAEIKAEMTDIATKIANGTIKVTNAQAGEAFDKSSLSHVMM